MKKITHYYGCKGRHVDQDLEILRKLEDEIDLITQVKKWIEP